MSDVVLKVENLSKLYRLGEVGTGTLSHDLNRWWAKVRGKEDPFSRVGEINDRTSGMNSKNGYVWSLKDVGFEVRRGDVLGVIGKNGAGKSTLLKLISQITAPTSGSIKAKGRIASLLEVGTGMHPEMTGRENIYLNGTILGMRKWEIDRKFDEIVDFAGCAKYVDTPVKRYSSGMKVRLGFAVAAFLEPEILIVDEVLAVGDAEFQKKAVGKMQEVSRNSGRTVLFVSHSLASVGQLCTRGICLDKGRVAFQGTTEETIGYYITSNKESTSLATALRKGNASARLDSIKVYSTGEAEEILTPVVGNNIYFEFHFPDYINFDDSRSRFDFRIENKYGNPVAWISTGMFAKVPSENKHVLRFYIEKCQFNAGQYTISTCLYVNGAIADWIQSAYSFIIEEGVYYKHGRLALAEQGDFLIDCKII